MSLSETSDSPRRTAAEEAAYLEGMEAGIELVTACFHAAIIDAAGQIERQPKHAEESSDVATR